MTRVRKVKTTLKRRNKKQRIEDLPLKNSDEQIKYIALTLARQIDDEDFKKKYAKAATVLKLVGAGAFLAASIAMPNLPRALKPFLKNENEFEVWKRFNIPYLKRTLIRLEKQKLVNTKTEGNTQIVELTSSGRKKVLRFALDEIEIKKPKFWNGKWWMVSYDIPNHSKLLRRIFRDYLLAWGFYPIHESVFLHAYPCNNEVLFLKEYLGIGEYVRMVEVARIENDKLFKEFFGI